MYFPLFVGVLCLSLFCYALVCVHSSFAITLKRKRKLVALPLLSYRCIVTIYVLWLFFTVQWVGLQCVIKVFPDHTHLLFALKMSISVNILFGFETFVVVMIESDISWTFYLYFPHIQSCQEYSIRKDAFYIYHNQSA